MVTVENCRHRLESIGKTVTKRKIDKVTNT